MTVPNVSTALRADSQSMQSHAGRHYMTAAHVPRPLPFLRAAITFGFRSNWSQSMS